MSSRRWYRIVERAAEAWLVDDQLDIPMPGPEVSPEKINACFVSYRHPKGALEAKWIQHVVSALTDHVAVHTHLHEVVHDKQRLVPGYQYHEILADEICRSACMVVVYWPSYLESDYCKREIEAMLHIEERRRLVLGSALHGCRLFIPLIIRGKHDDLPVQLRDIEYLDYRQQASLPNENIGFDANMTDKLDQVASYMKTLCDMLRGEKSEQLFRTCKEFTLSKAAIDFGDVIRPAAKQRFPGQSV